MESVTVSPSLSTCDTAAFRRMSESAHGRCHYEKVLSFPLRNIFRTSGLFFINGNGAVRVADDEGVEVERGEGT
jgi:hypothetical protein